MGHKILIYEDMSICSLERKCARYEKIGLMGEMHGGGDDRHCGDCISHSTADLAPLIERRLGVFYGSRNI